MIISQKMYISNEKKGNSFKKKETIRRMEATSLKLELKNNEN